MTWDWAFAWEVLPELLAALRITILATLLGMALACVLGIVWELIRRSRVRAFSWSAKFIVEFTRSTPLLVQIYFLYFASPIKLSPLTTGILALGFHYSSYLAEVYRAGIDGVDRGQWEAAKALNFSPGKTWRHIVLPQAIPPVLPVMGNYFIGMFKDSPMLSAITVLEVLQRARMIGSETFRYLEPLTIVGVLFLVLSLMAGGLTRWIERRLDVEGIRA